MLRNCHASLSWCIVGQELCPILGAEDQMCHSCTFWNCFLMQPRNAFFFWADGFVAVENIPFKCSLSVWGAECFKFPNHQIKVLLLLCGQQEAIRHISCIQVCNFQKQGNLSFTGPCICSYCLLVEGKTPFEMSPLIFHVACKFQFCRASSLSIVFGGASSMMCSFNRSHCFTGINKCTNHQPWDYVCHKYAVSHAKLSHVTQYVHWLSRYSCSFNA